MNRGNFIQGLLMGFVIPPLAYLAFTGIYLALENAGLASTEGFSPFFRERTTSIVAIGLNALLLNYFNKKNKTESVRGVVLPTFIFMAIWIYYFMDILFR